MRIGQTALELVQEFASRFAIESLSVIRHAVGVNWRQENDTVEKQAADFMAGFTHARPLEHRRYSRDTFLDLRLADLPTGPREAWSVCSNVTVHGRVMHLPMMNFHPQGIGIHEIKRAIAHLCHDHDGALLDSGRHQHYYGAALIMPDLWPAWMAEWLGPCVLVSPRYIGHRLHHGYATLRLTAEHDHKPKVPTVIWHREGSGW